MVRCIVNLLMSGDACTGDTDTDINFWAFPTIKDRVLKHQMEESHPVLNVRVQIPKHISVTDVLLNPVGSTSRNIITLPNLRIQSQKCGYRFAFWDIGSNPAIWIQIWILESNPEIWIMLWTLGSNPEKEDHPKSCGIYFLIYGYRCVSWDPGAKPDIIPDPFLVIHHIISAAWASFFIVILLSVDLFRVVHYQ